MKLMTIRDVQNVSLDILQDIHEFCEAHNIYYTLCGGTLIGAIRHKGFIPWDDDLDIAMPRPDYDRFIKSYKSKRGYMMFSREVKSEYNVMIAYTRICEMEQTIADSSKCPWVNCETGIWIEIFPLDGASAIEEETKAVFAKAFKFRLDGLRYRFSLVPFKTFYSIWGIRGVIKALYVKTLYSHSMKRLDQHIAACRTLDFDRSPFFIDLTVTHYGMKEWNPKDLLKDRILVPFEDHSFYIMSGYDQWLRRIYGDYMQLPPENKRVAPHELFEFYWK